MDNYFLISEFAKLRDININSLRYYEKLGILKPAYVDERTGYRYYATEQLPLLNNIILCVQLGISLKEMATYIDGEGNLQTQRLLEQGKIVAQERITEMQNNLKYIEHSLKNMEENKEFVNKEGTYTRIIRERKIITTDSYDDKLDVKKVVSKISELYKIAQKNNFFPILPAGQILELDKAGKVSIRFFLEILNCEDEYQRVEVLPAGEYSCVQLVLDPETDLEKRVRENWNIQQDSRIIIDNIVLDKYSFGTKSSELQKLERIVP